MLRTRIKRMLSIILLFCLVLTISPAVTLTAFAAEASYTVTFVVDQNDPDRNTTETVEGGAAIEQPVDPVRSGLRFLGWYDMTGNPYVFATPVNEDINLTARWCEGTSYDPFLIADMDDLRWMSAVTASDAAYRAADKVYKLTADIIYDGEGFNAITGAFSGTLDGQGYTITGLQISGAANCALISTLSGAVRNLGFIEITVVGTAGYVGGIAGNTAANFLIENCYVKDGTIIAAGENAGGLIGYAAGNAAMPTSIRNCYFTGSISNTNTGARTGGIVGRVAGITIENCYSQGRISAGGGIAGDTAGTNNTFRNCYSTVSIGGNGGGIIMSADESYNEHKQVIENCLALNPAIVGSGNRVAANSISISNTFPSVYAWEEMAIFGVLSYNGLAGVSVSTDDINTGAGWPIVFRSGAWSYSPGQLPVLTGLGGGGQDSAMPAHLKPLASGRLRAIFHYDDGVTPFDVRDVAVGATVTPPEEPIKASNKFMGWFTSSAAAEPFDFSAPLTENIALIPKWAAFGTAAAPYTISSMEDLAWMSSMVASATLYRNSAVYYVLTNDIVFDPEVAYNDVTFKPMGTSAAPFQGNLDGQGHTISGLTLDGGDYQGLFGYVQYGKIKNLGLLDVNISGGNYIGGIAGYSTGYNATEQQTMRIENCFVTGTVSGGQYVGGIAGYARGVYAYTAEITNCYFNGDVVASGNAAGGILGTSDRSILTNCYALGTVTAASNAGGVVGNILSNQLQLINAMALNQYITATTRYTGQAGRLYGGGAPESLGGYAWKASFVDAWVETVEPITLMETDDIREGGLPVGFLLSPWQYTPGSLPVLQDMRGQDGSFDVYNVSFDYNDGVTAPVEKEIIKGQKVLALTTPPDSGNTVKGWYLNAPGEYFDFSSPITSNITLTADLEPAWRVNFDANGGTATEAQMVKGGGYAVQPLDPMWSFRQFRGWYDGEILFDFNSPITKDLTLTARWTDGSPESPFEIADMADLRWMSGLFASSSTVVNYRDKNYILTADIVYDGEPFTGVAVTGVYAFAGVFDGRGHTISGLTITSGNYRSLFGDIVGGTVKNLGLINLTAISGTANPPIGGIAKSISDGTVIENCYVLNGMIAGTGSSVGGIVGNTNGSGNIINNCYFTGTVAAESNATGTTVNDNAGGIAGTLSSGSYIKNSYSAGVISGRNNVGGVVGSAAAGSLVENCLGLNRLVQATGSPAGSVIGLSMGDVGNCFGLGRVSQYDGEPGENGLPVGIAAINTSLGWPATFLSGEWSYTANQLPLLTGLDGQDGAMPDWLKALETGKNFRVSFLYADGETPDIYQDVINGATVAEPDAPTRGDYKFLGWFEHGAAEPFDFGEVVANDIFLIARWAPPGTAKNPIFISSMEDLRQMADMINSAATRELYRDKYYVMANDVVYDGGGFTPIGGTTAATAFTGIFDGQGYAISGLEFNVTNAACFFAYLNGATVKNLNLDYCSFITTNFAANNTGSIAMLMQAGSLIENCHVANSAVQGGASTTGGIVGSMNGNSRIENCSFDGAITSIYTGSSATSYVGGIAGNVTGTDNSIVNCRVNGTLSGGFYLGGIAGAGGSALIDNCSAQVVITCTVASGNYNSPLAGGVTSSSSGTIRNSWFNGSISSNDNSLLSCVAGGIVGDLVSGGLIENCYAIAVISKPNTAFASSNVGGIAGNASGTIRNSWFKGDVLSGGGNVGGIVGNLASNAAYRVENCYALGTVTGSSNVGGIAGNVGALASLVNCFALNENVAATTGNTGIAARVAGNKASGAGTVTSFAWDGMTLISPNNLSLTAIHGAPLSREVINTAAGWTETFLSDPWQYAAGFLPILAGLDGQDGTMPEYLRTSAAIKKGDVTGDGEIDIFDVRMILDHINGINELEGNAVQNADVNGDEDIDIFDVRMILDHINGITLIEE